MKKSRIRIELAAPQRRGTVVVLSALTIVGVLTFIAFATDLGMISLMKARMQTCADAASLAAATEIAVAIGNADAQVTNVAHYAEQQARAKAVEIAAANGFYVDPQRDVTFGRRGFDPNSGGMTTTWNVSPANLVRVNVRKDNPNLSAPDAQMKLFFARVLGHRVTSVVTDAAAYVEPRDIVSVVDLSGSMSSGSLFRYDTITNIGQPAIEGNLADIFTAINPPIGNMTFAPQYMTMQGELASPDDPVVDLTFKKHQVSVASDTPYEKIVLQYADSTEETIDATGHQVGTYQGTGDNAYKDITDAFVKFPGEPITVEGTLVNPFVTVTFQPDGLSVYITSTKDISNVVLEFTDGTHQRFESFVDGETTATLAGTGDYAGKIILGLWVKSGENMGNNAKGYGERFESPDELAAAIAYEFNDTNENVLAVMGLDTLTYPFPSGSWDQFITYVRTDSDVNRAGYREMYGGMTFVHYLMEIQPSAAQTPVLWAAPQYPLKAVKVGHTMLTNYLTNLGFDDHIGLVSYATTSRIEERLEDGFANIDISSQPITGNYSDVDTILQHRQAAHFDAATNIGGGIDKALELLDSDGRERARPTILLLTDGLPSAYSSYTIPSGFSWNDDFDFDHDAAADYKVQSTDYLYDAKMYAIVKALEARDANVTIHTMTIGNNADDALMQAIAKVTGGKSTNIPDGLAPAAFQAAVGDALQRLSSKVPPPKLLRE